MDDNGSTKGGKDGRHLAQLDSNLVHGLWHDSRRLCGWGGPSGHPASWPFGVLGCCDRRGHDRGRCIGHWSRGGGLPVRGRRRGLFAFGIVLWAAGRHLAPTVDRFFAPTTAGLLWDGLVLSAAIFGVSAVLTKVTGPACRPEPPDEGVPDRLAVGWLAMLVALPIAHLAAVTNDPGQAAGGAALGGVAAGLAGRLAAPHVSPFRLMLALVPIGVLGRAVVGSSLIDAEAWRLGAGPGLLATLPMDWAGAGVAGFALGAVWARGFLKPTPTGQNVASDAVSG